MATINRRDFGAVTTGRGLIRSGAALGEAVMLNISHVRGQLDPKSGRCSSRGCRWRGGMLLCGLTTNAQYCSDALD